ncbi:hypothetical protein KKF91_15665 [Myxococcota bacterium]|nr:hypothetical protein [Myxococcota bacterium]MBU1431978.1 hypothetical protein [Myxococcota bacterium]MBU1899831.1 hypothetical protein [Myxococcota bacterium]
MLKRKAIQEAQRPREGRTAVILNANAKRVNQGVKERVKAAAPQADIFFTETLDQAAFITRRIVDLGYSTVVTGGGDGTIVNTIDAVLNRAIETGVETPRFVILKLGTGNGIADHLGARDYLTDLAELDQAEPKSVDLLRVNGQRRATFAGFGWDAFILDRYQEIKKFSNRFRIFRWFLQSSVGYVLSALGRTVPELLIKRPRWKIRITNTGGIGRRLSADGRILERYAPGAVVYEGYSKLVCFGTTPYYGFKFNIMPFAAKTPGMFHLRCIDSSLLKAVKSFPTTWRTGRFEEAFDFQLSGCRVEVLDGGEVPLQIAGDAEGHHRQIDVELSEAIECGGFN